MPIGIPDTKMIRSLCLPRRKHRNILTSPRLNSLTDFTSGHMSTAFNEYPHMDTPPPPVSPEPLSLPMPFYFRADYLHKPTRNHRPSCQPRPRSPAVYPHSLASASSLCSFSSSLPGLPGLRSAVFTGCNSGAGSLKASR